MDAKSFSLTAQIWTPEDRDAYYDLMDFCEQYGISVGIVRMGKQNQLTFFDSGDGSAWRKLLEFAKKRHAQLVK